MFDQTDTRTKRESQDILDSLIREHFGINPDDKEAVDAAYAWLASESQELFFLLSKLDAVERKFRINLIANKLGKFHNVGKITGFIISEIMKIWDNGTEGNSWERSKKEIRESEDRHVIFMVKGELHTYALEAEDVLIRSGYPFYQWAKSLYTPKHGTGKDGSGNDVPILHMEKVTYAGLRVVLSENIAWYEGVKPPKEFPDRCWKKIDAPVDIVSIILAPDRQWAFPYCAGIIKTPVIKSEGTMVIKSGYDETTGFFLHDSGYGEIQVKDEPTRLDAEQALELLKSTHSGIPLVDYDELGSIVPHDPNKPSRSRSVLLACQMEPMVLCGKKPATCVHAPQYGSGKSYCCDICAQMPLGTNAVVTLFSKNGEELIKTLDSNLLKGNQFIVLDNAEGHLRNVRITQMIERDLVDVRILGKSEDVVMSFENGKLMINGVNIRIAADLVRRFTHIHLNAMMENPETRTFNVDQREVIRKNRGKFISAVLTIMKAFLAHGKPLPDRAMSYEVWSDTIRSALVWLGEADPWLSSQEHKADDPDRELKNDLFDGFNELIEPLLKSRELLGVGEDKLIGIEFLCNRLVNYVPRGIDSLPNTTLEHALVKICAVNSLNRLDSRKVGMYLDNIKDDPVDGFVMSLKPKVSKMKGSNTWRFYQFGKLGETVFFVMDKDGGITLPKDVD